MSPERLFLLFIVATTLLLLLFIHYYRSIDYFENASSKKQLIFKEPPSLTVLTVDKSGPDSGIKMSNSTIIDLIKTIQSDKEIYKGITGIAELACVTNALFTET